MPVPYANLNNPQSLNLYAYVGNNPLVNEDEDGHSGCKDTPELCRDVRDAVSSGHSITDGWVNNLTKITFGLAHGLKAAAKALDSFNSVLGSEKTNCAGGGSCSEALGTAASIVAMAIPTDGESEALFVEKQLSTAGEKIDNILGNITGEDLAAAEREAGGGMRVAKPGGGFYDHVDEVSQAIRGLEKQATHLERVLKRSGLSESQVGRLTERIEQAREGAKTFRQAIGGTKN